MGWEKKLAVVGAVPLVLIPVMFLTLFSEALAERFDLLTPGTVAMPLFLQLFPPHGLGLSSIGWVLLVDFISWIVILTVVYALIRQKKTVLKWTALPLAVVFGLECDGLALRYVFFTPGAALFRVLHQESAVSDSIALGLAVLFDAACWFAVFGCIQVHPQAPLRRKVE